MDVNIITIHDHLNYGAVLQAYALNRSIRMLGHGCRTIDCTIHRGGGRFAHRAKHPGARLSQLYAKAHGRANRRFEKKFKTFIHDHIPLTQASYPTLASLVDHPPPCDAMITGSDQVWQPKLLSQDIGPAYHLSFADHVTTRLISYAPSFGVSTIPDMYKETVARYLNRYDHLSVREARGKDIIFELTGKEAAHVLDPTLLLAEDNYESIVEAPSLDTDYILVYPMELGENRAFFHLVKEAVNHTRLPLVCVLPLVFDFRWLLLADKVILDAGPGEFLGLIKQASLVCTNSFHGTVFSIAYRKRFIGTPHSMTPSRVRGLLGDLGLLDRLVVDPGAETVPHVLDQTINWDDASEKLRLRVKASRHFLAQSLN